jgi:hypothetical protein
MIWFHRNKWEISQKSVRNKSEIRYHEKELEFISIKLERIRIKLVKKL